MSTLRYATRQFATRTVLRSRPTPSCGRSIVTGLHQGLSNPQHSPLPPVSSHASLRFAHNAAAASSPPALGTPERLPEFSLAGKTVVVTGGAQGLGLTQCGALLEAGATVYALDRQNSPSAGFATLEKRATESLGQKLHYRQVDVRDVPTLNTTIEAIADAEGGIHGLVAAAGIQQETPALEYTPEDANRMFEINVTGVFMTAQAVARQMVKRGTHGSLVFIASMSGTVANKGLICPAYNASKAAVVQLTRNLAAEWGAHGIRVNSISPGYIVTQMVEELFVKYPERRETWSKDNMLGRLSAPEEYRGAAVFLVSDASSFMTGGDLRIDGGHTAW